MTDFQAYLLIAGLATAPLIGFWMLVFRPIYVFNKKKADINVAARIGLIDAGFRISRTFYIMDNVCQKSLERDKSFLLQVHIDTANKKFAFIDYVTGEFFIVAYCDVVDWQVYKNYFATAKDIIKDTKLMIRVCNRTAPIEYKIVKAIGIKRLRINDPIYKNCSNSLEEFIAFLSSLNVK